MCFFLGPSPVRRVPIQTGIQRKLNFVSVRTIKGSSSPGLFTVFCLHCKICVAWELMEDTESPATAFRMFALRAWTRQDFETLRRWRSKSVWQDPSVEGDSMSANNDDTTESVVVPADGDVDPGEGGGSRDL